MDVACDEVLGGLSLPRSGCFASYRPYQGMQAGCSGWNQLVSHTVWWGWKMWRRDQLVLWCVGHIRLPGAPDRLWTTSPARCKWMHRDLVFPAWPLCQQTAAHCLLAGAHTHTWLPLPVPCVPSKGLCCQKRCCCMAGAKPRTPHWRATCGTVSSTLGDPGSVAPSDRQTQPCFPSSLCSAPPSLPLLLSEIHAFFLLQASFLPSASFQFLLLC